MVEGIGLGGEAIYEEGLVAVAKSDQFALNQEPIGAGLEGHGHSQVAVEDFPVIATDFH